MSTKHRIISQRNFVVPIARLAGKQRVGHEDAVHMLGNAVCPPAARDVITAMLEAA